MIFLIQVDDTEAKDTDDHTDFRENSKFADHMKVKISKSCYVPVPKLAVEKSKFLYLNFFRMHAI